METRHSFKNNTIFLRDMSNKMRSFLTKSTVNAWEQISFNRWRLRSRNAIYNMKYTKEFLAVHMKTLQHGNLICTIDSIVSDDEQHYVDIVIDYGRLCQVSINRELWGARIAALKQHVKTYIVEMYEDLLIPQRVFAFETYTYDKHFIKSHIEKKYSPLDLTYDIVVDVPIFDYIDEPMLENIKSTLHLVNVHRMVLFHTHTLEKINSHTFKVIYGG